MYNLNSAKQKFNNIEEWLAKEYQGVRTGRATPAVLDSINVEMYGSMSKISHVAAISVEDPKTLRIAPWDKGAVKAIETAIAAANLGLSVVPDAGGLRVVFPDLTADRRKMLEKLLKEKMEEARVSVKREREEIWNEIVKSEKDGNISEDEKFKLKDDLQKLVDGANMKLEETLKHKVEEISK